jgi:hypothetical protein
LLDYPQSAIGPGHGFLIDKPEAEIQWLDDHRLVREDKVVAGLSQCGLSTLDELTPVVYADVDTSLHPIARYSLWAHIIKLQKEGRVVAKGEQWELVA